MVRQVYCDTVLFARSDAVRLVRDAELYIPIITVQYGTYFYRTLMLRVVHAEVSYKPLEKYFIAPYLPNRITPYFAYHIAEYLPCHIGPHSPYRIASYRLTSYLSFHVIQYRRYLLYRIAPYMGIETYLAVSHGKRQYSSHPYNEYGAIWYAKKGAMLYDVVQCLGCYTIR